jgi:alpha-L-rhamnosidase
MRTLFFTLFTLCCTLLATAQISVTHLRLENLENPVGLDVKVPRFSWHLLSDRRNTSQSHYEIRVSQDESFKKVLWTSGKNMSNQSILVPYNGPALQSNTRYYWQVRAWDQNEGVSAWSSVAWWHTGLLNNSDWTANWISPANRSGHTSPYLRTDFSAKKKIKNATVFVSAHGLYELYLNGQRVGQDQLTPGWTAYQKRLQYQCYDVTNLVQAGNNTVGAILANGWYLGELGWQNHRNIYGKELALIAQLDITYTDGSTQRVQTDGSWTSADGAVRFSEIYDGEQVDYRLEPTGWNNPGFNAKGWTPVKTQDFPKDVLVATYNEPIRARETFVPKADFIAPNGQKTLDFGQNLVGIVQVTAKGSAGARLVLRYAEVLDPRTGNPYFDNLRHAASSDTFYLSGKGTETCAARFTFHGFRYATYELTGNFAQKPEFTAIAWYSNMPQTGSFECAHPLINQLQHNIQWGQRGNFLDVPTDCPQRDERMGWTGDAQVFANTALYNFDAHNFFAKWLKDVAADQRPDGKVPFVVPNVLDINSGGSTGWADVATIIPWNTYVATADKRILEEQYESMKAWVGYMETNSKNHLWNTGFHFGDWLFYDVDDDRDGRSAITDKYYIAQCFFAYSIQLTLKTAQLLNKTADIEKYTVLLKNVKAAFLNEYITPNGRPISSTQTAYTLALQFDMLPEAQRANAAKALVDNIRSYGNHLTTGFLGTPYLCHVLSRFGYEEVAYDLLFQETYPSWLYPVKMGATTIWERWDGIKPDSSFQSITMNSFNHYAYGAIGDWMYRNIAGIQSVADRPGYKHTNIAPHPCENLAYAKGSLMSPHGLVRSDWRIVGDTFFLEVDIPVNTTATVEIPTIDIRSVRENGLPLAAVKDITAPIDVSKPNLVRVKLGSGKWSFQAQSPVILPPPHLREFTGKFSTGGWSGRSEFKIKEGQLQLINNLGTTVLVKDRAQKDGFAGPNGLKVTFMRSENGTINGVELSKPDGGSTLRGKKTK